MSLGIHCRYCTRQFPALGAAYEQLSTAQRQRDTHEAHCLQNPVNGDCECKHCAQRFLSVTAQHGHIITAQGQRAEHEGRCYLNPLNKDHGLSRSLRPASARPTTAPQARQTYNGRCGLGFQHPNDDSAFRYINDRFESSIGRASQPEESGNSRAYREVIDSLSAPGTPSVHRDGACLSHRFAAASNRDPACRDIFKMLEAAGTTTLHSEQTCHYSSRKFEPFGLVSVNEQRLRHEAQCRENLANSSDGDRACRMILRGFESFSPTSSPISARDGGSRLTPFRPVSAPPLRGKLTGRSVRRQGV